jgi:glycosyltransferase involved in cell wall biosynthesis
VLLPSANGKYANTALRCFCAQSYKGRLELVIVDNAEDDALLSSVDKLIKADSIKAADGVAGFSAEFADGRRVKYLSLPHRPIGALRNVGNWHAEGDIIVHFDDDDWHHADRVERHVSRLLETGKAVTGFHSALYFNDDTGGLFRYHYSPGRPHEPYAWGATLAYTRNWWEKHSFPETDSEDRPFTDAALHAKQLDSCESEQLIVCRVHGRNLCAKQNYLGRHKQWPAATRGAFPQDFFAAITAERCSTNQPASGGRN